MTSSSLQARRICSLSAVRYFLGLNSNDFASKYSNPNVLKTFHVLPREFSLIMMNTEVFYSNKIVDLSMDSSVRQITKYVVWFWLGQWTRTLNPYLHSGEKFWNTMMRSLKSIIIFLAFFIPNLRSGEKFWNTMMRSLKNIRGDVLDRGRERYTRT